MPLFWIWPNIRKEQYFPYKEQYFPYHPIYDDLSIVYGGCHCVLCLHWHCVGCFGYVVGSPVGLPEYKPMTSQSVMKSFNHSQCSHYGDNHKENMLEFGPNYLPPPQGHVGTCLIIFVGHLKQRFKCGWRIQIAMMVMVMVMVMVLHPITHRV